MTCSKCGVEKPLTEFRLRQDQPGRRYGTCNDCKRAYGRAHYAANKDYYKEKASRQRTPGRQGAANYPELIAYLRAHPCVDCGETDVRVLQFDHVDPATKSYTISLMVRRYAWAEVLGEIAKCEIRCGNCHRLKTLRERGLLPLEEQLSEAAFTYAA